MTDPKLALDIMAEKLTTLDNKVGAAHQRMDKFEIYNADTLKEIKMNVKDIQISILELSAFMHRSRGWAAAAVFVAGIIGTFLLDKIFKFLPHLTTLFKGD